MGKMYVNIIHRADRSRQMGDALKFQLDEAHRLGFAATILVSFQGLTDPETVAYVREQKEQFGDEVGIHFHEMMCEELMTVAESTETALYLHTVSSREKIVRFIFRTFEEQFGFIPEAVGGYILDAPLLKLIHALYPQVKVAITNCFEEGVKMFEGNKRSWFLFSDGGPWGPYYPSRSNYLLPAGSEEDYVGILGLPHLNRDMLMAITSRDDYFASHPVNVVRAKANDGPESPYLKRFIDQWIEQIAYNGFSYYSLFVSTPWLNDDSVFSPSSRDARALYTESLEFIKKRCEEGKAEVVTMAGFADWYTSHVPVGTPEVNLWKDILCGTRRQMFWYVGPGFRAAVDMNTGGSICDFRPYSGRLERDIGPDSRYLYNSNYPFTISTEHRPSTRHTCLVNYGGQSAWVFDKRTRASVARAEDGRAILTLEPVRLKFGEDFVMLQTVMTFEKDGGIRFERRILEVSDDTREITVTEHHAGSVGTTEYPEDMRDILLQLQNDQGERIGQIDYHYMTRKVTSEAGWAASAIVPQAGCSISLCAVDRPLWACIEEGSLFMPCYSLQMGGRVKKGEAMVTCLKVDKL